MECGTPPNRSNNLLHENSVCISFQNGLGNEEACQQAPIVILSVPFEHCASTLKGIKQSLSAGQIVVSMAVIRITRSRASSVKFLAIWWRKFDSMAR